MKYILIRDIQRISKEMHMPQNSIDFHVSMWWVVKNMKFGFYSFINIFGHTTWNFLIIHIKSHLFTRHDNTSMIKLMYPTNKQRANHGFNFQYNFINKIVTFKTNSIIVNNLKNWHTSMVLHIAEGFKM
jgi:hypothetical protein